MARSRLVARQPEDRLHAIPAKRRIVADRPGREVNTNSSLPPGAQWSGWQVRLLDSDAAASLIMYDIATEETRRPEPE